MWLLWRTACHRDRQRVKPMLQHLRAIKVFTDERSHSWNIKLTFPAGGEQFFNCALDTAEAYLIVCAAVNTYVYFRGFPKASTMAEEILELAKKAPRFTMPDAMSHQLKLMAEGKSNPLVNGRPLAAASQLVVAEPSAPVVASQVSTSSGSAVLPPRRVQTKRTEARNVTIPLLMIAYRLVLEIQYIC